jgi:hypothetical protein
MLYPLPGVLADPTIANDYDARHVAATHATLPLAILRALVEARRRLGTEVGPAVRIPQIRQASAIIACCDNFV